MSCTSVSNVLVISGCEVNYITLLSVTRNSLLGNPVATSFPSIKSSMARSLPVENLLPQNVGSIINYLQ